MVALSLSKGLDALVVVSTHSNLSYIYIAVGHSDASQILVLDLLTSCCELSHSTQRSSLGSLTAGVGVNLGIEYQDVYILAGSDNVIQTAEADIVSPAVAAEDPDALLSQEFLILQDSLAVRAVRMLSSSATRALVAALLAVPSSTVDR